MICFSSQAESVRVHCKPMPPFSNGSARFPPRSWPPPVCTDALLLGAAGFLEGKRATTHATALNELTPYCATVVQDRIVDEGNVVTAGGVASSIDLGLHIVERLAGPEARARIATQMAYPY
ncbi:MAG: hypothetical protein LZF86_190463 [Nitrospira sp.]|nr:MAG: hypothetical protein LZF86_190463 [Nitrospira sp.]